MTHIRAVGGALLGTDPIEDNTDADGSVGNGRIAGWNRGTFYGRVRPKSTP